MTKKTVTPKMYALATLIFFVILALLLVTNLSDRSGEDVETSPQKAPAEEAQPILTPCSLPRKRLYHTTFPHHRD